MSHTWGLSGVINLPYAEIEEPFEAWYNLTGNKSRIQYYGGKQAGVHCGPMQREDAGRTTVPQFPLPAGTGQVITYQLGGVKPYGMQYKITPETTEKKVNTRACFQLPGSKEDVVKAQSVFPSMDGFKVRNAGASSGGGAGQLEVLLSVLGVCGAGTGQDMSPHAPGHREGHFPARTGAGVPAPFPTPAAVLGRVAAHSAGVSGRLGQVAARRFSSRRPLTPAELRATRERWGQQGATKLGTSLQGESLETHRETPRGFGRGCAARHPHYGCTYSGMSVLCCTPNPSPMQRI